LRIGEVKYGIVYQSEITAPIRAKKLEKGYAVRTTTALTSPDASITMRIPLIKRLISAMDSLKNILSDKSYYHDVQYRSI
jgi:hypothetical protein